MVGKNNAQSNKEICKLASNTVGGMGILELRNSGVWGDLKPSFSERLCSSLKWDVRSFKVKAACKPMIEHILRKEIQSLQQNCQKNSKNWCLLTTRFAFSMLTLLSSFKTADLHRCNRSMKASKSSGCKKGVVVVGNWEINIIFQTSLVLLLVQLSRCSPVEYPSHLVVCCTQMSSKVQITPDIYQSLRRISPFPCNQTYDVRFAGNPSRNYI